MTAESRNNMGSVLARALRSKVTQSVKDEIAAVLEVNTDRMNARQAIAYAQIAKAIKGDRAAFEAISTMQTEKADRENSFCVEVKVVD